MSVQLRPEAPFESARFVCWMGMSNVVGSGWLPLSVDPDEITDDDDDFTIQELIWL